MRSRRSTQPTDWMGALVVPALMRALDAVRVVTFAVRKRAEARRHDDHGQLRHSYD
jgi:hypothetical protein